MVGFHSDIHSLRGISIGHDSFACPVAVLCSLRPIFIRLFGRGSFYGTGGARGSRCVYFILLFVRVSVIESGGFHSDIHSRLDILTARILFRCSLMSRHSDRSDLICLFSRVLVSGLCGFYSAMRSCFGVRGMRFCSEDCAQVFGWIGSAECF